MEKPKILFIANNNIGFGLSGGDTIFIQLLNYWQKKCQLTLLGCQEAINILPSTIRHIKIIITDKVNPNPQNSLVNLFFHYFRRICKGLSGIGQNYQALSANQFVYSVSDFLPDLLPALYLKIRKRSLKWIAAYFLFAPNPLSKETPYRGLHRLKGLVYWLIQKFTLPLVNHFADLIFVTSVPDQHRFRYPRKVIVIQGGVDLPNIKSYLKSHPLPPLKRRYFAACYLGRFHPQKGVLELIDIWKTVVRAHPEAKLALIGQGELESKMRLKIKTLRLHRHIKIFGFLIGSPKYAIFGQSKIVVHPATYDSGGMSAAEAMAFGLPGVSFDLESLKTYYPEGMIKTPCFDLDQFAKNICRLLDDQKLYQSLSLKAARLIASQWDWSKKSSEILRSLISIS